MNGRGVFVVVGLTAGVATAGCSQPIDEANVSSSHEDLYRLGPTYPNGEVPVCFSGSNNASLASQVQRLLAFSWETAANVHFYDDCAPEFIRHTVSLSFDPDTNGNTSGPGNGLGTNARNVSIISNDPDPFQQHFRYEVLHEFGHVLGYAHEQERPDNWTAAGGAISCGQTQGTRKALNGGVNDTPSFDLASIMDYCTTEPLVGGPFRTLLSSGDINGVRVAYGRNIAAHGFEITSDSDTRLQVNAWGGAVEGAALILTDACGSDNPDCTWSYQYGMIVSDRDPTLAINAAGGARFGADLLLTSACTPSNPDCTWTYKNGEFLSDTNQGLAINAFGGAAPGTPLKLHDGCTASNKDCTWTLPQLMLSSARNETLGVNAFGGAADGTLLVLNNACDQNNPDCTWIFRRGQIISTNGDDYSVFGLKHPLAINAWGGATAGGLLALSSICTDSNPDCTWTWTHGELLSDRDPSLAVNAYLGAIQGTQLFLSDACSAANADCVFSSFLDSGRSRF